MQQGSAEAAEDLIHPLAAQLAEMGFPLNWCHRAIQEVVRTHLLR